MEPQPPMASLPELEPAAQGAVPREFGPSAHAHLACDVRALGGSSGGGAAGAAAGGERSSRRVEAIKRLSVPAFADPLRLPGGDKAPGIRPAPLRQAITPLLAPNAILTSVAPSLGGGGGDGGVAPPPGVRKREAINCNKRRLTHEINECLELFRQRDGGGGLPSTPVSSKSSRHVNPLRRLAADARASLWGSPTSRLGSPSVRMFTYQVRAASAFREAVWREVEGAGEGRAEEGPSRVRAVCALQPEAGLPSPYAPRNSPRPLDLSPSMLDLSPSISQTRAQELAQGANDISLIQHGGSPTMSLVSPCCSAICPSSAAALRCLPPPLSPPARAFWCSPSSPLQQHRIHCSSSSPGRFAYVLERSCRRRSRWYCPDREGEGE